MAQLFTRIQETAEALKSLGLTDPAILLIYWGRDGKGLLPGLRPLADLGDLPHCRAKGRLLCSGRIVLLEDAPSCQDGVEIECLAQLPRAMRLLGAEALVLAGPAKVLDAGRESERLILLADHLNLTGNSPLVGPHEPRLGERFPDMGKAWSSRLREIAMKAAQLREAVLAGLAGPGLETPAQLNYLAAQGADLADWRFLVENQAAVHAGMEVLGLAWPRTNGEEDPSPESLKDLRAVLAALAASPEYGEES